MFFISTMFCITIVVLTVAMLADSVTSAEVNCGLPPPRLNMSLCCTAPLLVSGIGEKCMGKNPSSGPMSNICFGECIFNETGLSVNGVVQIDTARAVLSERMKNAPEFVPIVEQAMVKCDKMVKDRMAARASQPAPPVRPNCNPMTAMIAMCTMAESFVNCPESKWQSNEACNAVRQHMKMCKLPSMQPPS